MGTSTDDLVARLERLAAKYEANHLADHARGVHHAIREVRAFKCPGPIPATQTQYAAAYRADNGNVIAISTPNAMREYAENEAEAMRSPEDRTPIFVAFRDLPKWQPTT